jgi:hypothetical protein
VDLDLGLDEGAAAADVAQAPAQPLAGPLVAPADRQVDGDPLVAPAALHRLAGARQLQQILGLGALAGQELDAHAGADLLQVAARATPGDAPEDQQGRLPPAQPDLERHDPTHGELLAGRVEDAAVGEVGSGRAPKLAAAADDQLRIDVGGPPFGRVSSWFDFVVARGMLGSPEWEWILPANRRLRLQLAC